MFAASVLAGVSNPVAAQAQAQAPRTLHSPDVRKIDKIFEEYTKPGSPGCSVGVIQNGGFTYRHSYGLANLELGVPLSSKSVFYVGSVSKQFTAAAIVIAAEEGLLSLDDDIRKWLPEMPDYGHKISIRNLIHHTSGIRDSYVLLYLSGRRWEARYTDPEMLDLIAHQKALNFEPGTQYSYSNSNYFLLAQIIRRATGKPLSEFARENIFAPLGMTHTLYYDDAGSVVPDRVSAYAAKDDGGGYRIAWSSEFETVGAGGVMTTMDDLLKWDRNFYASKIGGPEFLPQMLTKGRLNDGTELPHAGGLLVYSARGVPVVSYAGALFGYRAFILRFPEQKTSIITMCNIAFSDHERRGWEVANIVLNNVLQPLPQPSATPASVAKSLETPAAAKPEPISDPKLLAAYIGTYESDEFNTRYQLFLKDGSLMLQNGWTEPFALRSTAADQFSGDYMRITFERDNAAQVIGFQVASPTTHGHPFKRVAVR